MASTVRLVCAAAAFVVVGACNAILGIEEPFDAVDGGGIGATGGADASSGGQDAGGAGGSGGVGGGGAGAGGTGAVGSGGTPGDAGGDAGGEPACDPNQSPVAGAVFVSPAGSDTNNGTAQFPVLTLGEALSKAKAALATRIYLAVGDYNLTATLELGAAEQGIIIEGGWQKNGSTWTPHCVPSRRTYTTVSVASDVAVRVTDMAQVGGLRHLTVATKSKGSTTAGAAGQSVVGIWASGAATVYNLLDVDVVAGDGGDGGEPPAAPAAAGTSTCNGVAGCCTTEPGCGNTNGPDAPAKAATGNAASQGTFAASGYAPGNAADGNPGALGVHGKAGNNGPSTGKTCYATGNCGSCNAGQCTGGSTLGGPSPQVGAPGRCGCAGLGGGGGKGGRGGGASIALLITQGATVSASYSTFHAGKGGGGAAGGAGGPGGQGANGSAGPETGCTTGCYGGCSSTCSVYDTVSGGPAGTRGGVGGEGGDGGGGSGGPSYAVVQHGGGKLSDGGDNGFIWSSGGAGVAGGAPGSSGGVHTAQ